MSYTDKLLAADEHIVYRTRQHPAVLARAFIGAAFWLTFGGFLLFGIFYFGDRLPDFGVRPPAWMLPGFIVLWVLIAVARVADDWLRWHSQDYVVTNRRLIKVEGVVSKQAADSSLEKINDVRFEQSLLGRLLNYGDIEILTAAAESDHDDFFMIRRPLAFKRAMIEAKEARRGGGD